MKLSLDISVHGTEKAGVKDYRSFATQLLKLIPNRPISFEVISDDLVTIEQEARKIDSILYRSHPAFQIIPIDASLKKQTPLEEDPLYHTKPLIASGHPGAAEKHDSYLYS